MEKPQRLLWQHQGSIVGGMPASLTLPSRCAKQMCRLKAKLRHSMVRTVGRLDLRKCVLTIDLQSACLRDKAALTRNDTASHKHVARLHVACDVMHVHTLTTFVMVDAPALMLIKVMSGANNVDQIKVACDCCSAAAFRVCTSGS